MAPKQNSETRKANLAKAREVSAATTAQSDQTNALAVSEKILASARAQVTSLEVAVENLKEDCARLSRDLDTANSKISELNLALQAEHEHSENLYKSLRVERRARQRADKRKQVLAQTITELRETTETQLQKRKELEKSAAITENEKQKIELSNIKLRAELLSNVQIFAKELALSKAALKGSKSQIYNLKRKCSRAVKKQENAVKRAQAKVAKEKTTFYLLNKGVYSQEVRNLVRTLTQAGCSQQHIMDIIKAVLETAGITAVGKISPRTVGRIIREGYYAACLQLGYEINEADSLTFSADGTGHKNLNYNSRHANYFVTDKNGNKVHVTRFLGLQTSLDGSSEQAVSDWDDELQNIADIFNDSPLAQESDNFLRLVEIYVKLSGMSSDHCGKEKKDFKLMGIKKTAAIEQVLGEKHIHDDSVDELMPQYILANQEMLKEIGGEAAWNALDEAAQKELKSEMLQKLTADLGKDAFEKLSDQEKRIFKLFIWVGCGCHKDLNTVLGGYIALTKFWEENELEPPILLPNKFNAAVINDAIATGSDNDATLTATRRAVQNSSRGAIKATKLAGDILNNKNDKSGHHDQFRIWWREKVGNNFTFPDTSNTRFQSHCLASAALIMDHDQFIAYLEYAKGRKDKVRFSHMEQNLWKALHDVPTRTEFAVMALYSQAVSHPYMKIICGDPPLNALDLGPLNKKIGLFMDHIIDDPTFLAGNNVSHEKGTFDRTPWNSKEVIERINELASEFPNLKPALVAFFKGARATWQRFTSEYAPGGLIDEATEEEKNRARMPASNDDNEGALGSFRVMMHRQPQLTLLQYNARAMFKRNNTAEFMEEKFSEKTHQYIRELSREKPTKEKERKAAIVKHTEEKIAVKAGNKKKREAQAAQLADRVAKVTLIFDKDEVDKLKGEKLKDHMRAFKTAGAPNLKNVKAKTLVADIRNAIKEAIDLFNEGKWTLPSNYAGPQAQGEESGEDFGFSDPNSSDEGSGWETEEEVTGK